MNTVAPTGGGRTPAPHVPYDADRATVFAEVLDELLTGYPYNSATQLHEYFGGRTVPRPYGASCAWQSFEAGRLVAERTGAAVEHPADGRHVAALFPDADGLTVLDPYLLHRLPLRLDRAAAEDGVVRRTVDAYPLRVRADGSPAPSRVRATWRLDDDAVRLDYLRHSPRRGHNVLSRSFTLRPATRMAQVPPPAEEVRPLLLHPEQHSVSVRVVHPGERLMGEVVLPLAGRPTGVRGDAALMIGKDNQGAVSRPGSAAFGRTADLVADAVGVPYEELAGFLLEAAALHRAAAPASLALAAYPVEDE
ncbi:hypothetical protein ACFY9C_06820 [Streptomyces filamentosus]|uniref:hypothetical protein n=1 Tax=Streptomyces filamentosus TaxID=67294 RepID=UPI0036E230B1